VADRLPFFCRSLSQTRTSRPKKSYVTSSSSRSLAGVRSGCGRVGPDGRHRPPRIRVAGPRKRGQSCSRGRRSQECRLRRGSVAPLVAVTVPAIMGFVALSVDYGYVAATKAQLQNAADAAALAGASAYFSNAGMRTSDTELTDLATSRPGRSRSSTRRMARRRARRQRHQPRQHDFGIGPPMQAEEPWNAVDVFARRTADSPMGRSRCSSPDLRQTAANVTAHSRAVADDRAAGYRLRRDGFLCRLPFTSRYTTHARQRSRRLLV